MRIDKVMDDREGSRRRRSRISGLLPAGGKGRSLLVSAAAFAVILALLVLEYLPRKSRYELGEASMETVISSRAFEVLDGESTERLRQEERERTKDLFVSREARDEAVERLDGLFARAGALRGEEGAEEEKLASLREGAPPELEEETLRALLAASAEDTRLLYTSATQLLNAAMSQPVGYDNLEQVREQVRSRAGDLPLTRDFREAVADLAEAFLDINTNYSAATVLSDMEEAANRVQPVYARYVAGQKIVGKGEVITPLILDSLEAAGALSPMGSYQQVVGVALFSLLLYLLGLFFFARFRGEWAAEPRVVASLCIVILVFAFLARLFSVFADENPLWGYLVPLAVVGLTVVALLDRLTALFAVTLGGMTAGIFLKGNFPLTLAAITGGAISVFLLGRLSRREVMIRAGAVLSLCLAAVFAATASLFQDLRSVFLAGALGVGNGVFCTLLTLGMIPVMERLSGIMTPMHLLELASPDHPLMRMLMNEAPGTYGHSTVVGNLAEAAAQAVGADPLLARVGAFYHDVGKLRRPAFFVENRPDGHDGLKPNLSALVITAHVKEGVELAREYGLPREVVDIIRQHHGTSLVRYFYAQALKEKKPSEEVSENRFRYPGQKPRSKEAAIVMLADAVEAVAKAADRPTPIKLEQLTRNMIRERLDDGQLSECGLTLGDLEKITMAFTRVLCGMYHERVEYPSLVKGEGA
jgi:putative nucleotidyltransferase with HDIG domain